MAYYHVRLDVHDERYGELKTDLDAETLEEQFMGPYRLGEPVTVNGRTLDWDVIERIRISESDQPISDLAAQVRAQDRASSVAVIGGPSASWRAAGRARDLTDQYITGPPGHGTPALDGAEQMASTTDRGGGRDGRSVFIVAGRDNGAAKAVKDLLRSLDLRIVEWEHAVARTGETSPYIGDVVMAGMEMAHAVVVLLTPDDRVQLRSDLLRDDDESIEREVRLQARPNVYYEAGIADALGRDRTVIVEVGRVKSFSDQAGRHVVRYDGSAARRNALAERLRIAGLDVNTGGQDWLSAGDVDGALAEAREAQEDFSTDLQATRVVTTETLLSDLEKLFQEYDALRGRSQYDDISDLPDETHELTIRMQALIDRVASGSTYAAEAARASNAPPHERLPALVAALRAMRHEFDDHVSRDGQE